jgi:hypothetical protein
MAAPRRIFYATHAIGAAPLSSTNYAVIHGAQTAGVNTNYSLQNIQELGQVALYELIELIPEIEVTIEKVLDGYSPIYHLVTQGTTDGSLAGRSDQQAMIAMSVYGDTQSSASGTPVGQIEMSGMFWSQHSLSFPVDRPFMENCTLVGNNKINKTASPDFTPTFTNTDAPLALAGSGGVQIRNDMIFYPILNGAGYTGGLETVTTLDVNGQSNAFLTILPPDIPGISASGTNDINATTGDFGCHIQNITASVNAGRDAILELGRKYPYYRFMSFPVAVTCEISIIATNVDNNIATEQGLDGLGDNLLNRTIKLRAREGSWLNLGTQNKCQSVSFGGGGADGGNSTLTYSYITYDQYYFAHPEDPSVLLGNIPYPY